MMISDPTLMYAQWAIIAVLTHLLFNFYIKEKGIYNYWLLLLITIVPITIIIALINIFFGERSYRTFDNFLMAIAFWLPSVLFIVGLTLTIKAWLLKRKNIKKPPKPTHIE